MPEILRSQTEDVNAAYWRLAESLQDDTQTRKNAAEKPSWQ
jgi:hypothetical protein